MNQIASDGKEQKKKSRDELLAVVARIIRGDDATEYDARDYQLLVAPFAVVAGYIRDDKTTDVIEATEYDAGDYELRAVGGTRIGSPIRTVAFLDGVIAQSHGWSGHNTLRYFHIDCDNQRVFIGQGVPAFGSGKVYDANGVLLKSRGLDRS